MLTLYGIKNCDTVKKARRRLEEQGVDYRFHDFRADGLDRALLERFEAALGWEALLNRQGTTWRKLDESAKSGVDRTKALELMLAQPSLIKRPVLEYGSEFALGYAADRPYPPRSPDEAQRNPG